MKKGLCIVLLCILATVLSISAIAEDKIVVNDLVFSMRSDGTAMVSSYIGKEEHIIIPEKINNTWVTAIRSMAFFGNADIETIEFPPMLERIGYNAFSGCESLREIVFPERLEFIGEEAFSLCTSLTKIDVPVCEMGSGVFTLCSRLSDVMIADGLEKIPARMFDGCSSLKQIHLPDSIIEIGTASFSGSALESLVLPKNLEIIGHGAFQGCKNLNSIQMPDKLKKIENLAFYGCEKIKSITIPNGVSVISDSAFAQCKKLEEVNLPETLFEIGELAFWECTNLKHLIIPEGVTQIKKLAFRGCTNLETLELPKTLESLGEGVFTGCTRLEHLRLSSSIEAIGEDAFSDCSRSLIWCVDRDSYAESYAQENKIFYYYSDRSIEDVYATEDWKWRFYDYVIRDDNTVKIEKCYASPKELVVPSYIKGKPVTEIGEHAYAYHTHVTSVVIGETIAKIGESAFYKCTALESVVVKGSVNEICDLTFMFCSSLREIVLPDSITNIGQQAFCDCAQLSEFRWPAQLEYIGRGAFEGCDNLAIIRFPDGLKSIEREAFDQCSRLMIAEFPRSIEHVEPDAFREQQIMMVVRPDSYAEDFAKEQGFAFTTEKSVEEILKNTNEVFWVISSFYGSGWKAIEELQKYHREERVFVQQTSEIIHSDSQREIELLGICYVPHEDYLYNLIDLDSAPYISGGKGISNYRLFSDWDLLIPVRINSKTDSSAYVDTEGVKITINDVKLDGYVFLPDESDYCVIRVVGKNKKLKVNSFYDLENIVIPELMFIADNNQSGELVAEKVLKFENGELISEKTNVFTELRSAKVEYQESEPEQTYLETQKAEVLSWYIDENPDVIVNSNEEYELVEDVYISLSEVSVEADGEELELTVAIENRTSSMMQITVENMVFKKEAKRWTSKKDYVLRPGEIGSITAYALQSQGEYNENGASALGDITIFSKKTGEIKKRVAICYDSKKYKLRDNTKIHDMLLGGMDSDFWYVLNEADEAMIIKYEGEAQQVIIPQYVDNVMVTAVDQKAFISKHERVQFHEAIKDIHSEAIVNKSVIAVVYPSTLAETWAIENAFSVEYVPCVFEENGMRWEITKQQQLILKGMLDRVQKLSIPGMHKGMQVIAIEELGKTDKLAELIIEQGVERIGERAFYNAFQLESIELPESLREIGDSAFAKCGKIEAISFPNELRSIGNNAFEGCEEIQELYIPECVNAIGYNAFGGMKQLKSITVSPDNERYADIDGVLYNKADKALLTYPCGKENRQYSIPKGIVRIEPNAISEVPTIQSLLLPDTLKEIGDYSLTELPNLQAIEFPNGLEKIGEGILSGCSAIEMLVVPGSVKRIPHYAFSELTGLLICVISEGVQEIGNGVLRDSSNIAMVYLPESVKSIGEQFAWGYETNCHFVVKNGTYAAEWTSNIDKNSSHTWMVQSRTSEKEALEYKTEHNNRLLSQIIGKAVVLYLVDENGNAKVQNVYSSGAQRIEIPSTVNGCVVSGVGDDAFYHAKSLQAVTLPHTMREIGARAFEDTCIEEMILPKMVMWCGEGMLKKTDITNLTIPGTLSVIPAEFAMGTGKLEHVLIEEGVDVIESRAFYASSIKTVELPVSIMSIAPDAFPAHVTVSVVKGSQADIICNMYGLHCSYRDEDVVEIPESVLFEGETPIVFPNEAVEWLIREITGIWDPDILIYPKDVKGITELSLSGLGIQSIEFLEAFTGLKRLCIGSPISQPEWSDDDLLQDARRRGMVYYSGNNRFVNLSPIAHLKELEELDISFCGVEDLTPLRELPRLKSLDLRGIPAEDYNALEALEELEILSLWDCKIKDLLPLKGLEKLRELNLEATVVETLEPLRNLKNLRSINLFDCRNLTNTQALEDMLMLEEIWIDPSHGNRMKETLGDRVKP